MEQTAKSSCRREDAAVNWLHKELATVTTDYCLISLYRLAIGRYLCGREHGDNGPKPEGEPQSTEPVLLGLPPIDQSHRNQCHDDAEPPDLRSTPDSFPARGRQEQVATPLLV